MPSLAAENLNSREGAQYMAQLARDAGFQKVEIIDTDGKPGVFATLDAGAEKTVGLYFMYDVKQFDVSEWSSPPRSEEHTSELQSLMRISDAVFCLKKKNIKHNQST